MDPSGKAEHFDRTTMVSSLWLQTVLYYNMLFSLMVFPFLIAITWYKVCALLCRRPAQRQRSPAPPASHHPAPSPSARAQTTYIQHVVDKQFFQSLVWPLLVIATVTEVFRVYYGYSGNLTEQVSHMSSFLLLTVFPQIPALAFHCLLQEQTYPFERTCGYLMLVMLVIEFYLGNQANQKLIRRQTASFLRLCQDNAEATTAALPKRD